MPTDDDDAPKPAPDYFVKWAGKRVQLLDVAATERTMGLVYQPILQLEPEPGHPETKHQRVYLRVLRDDDYLDSWPASRCGILDESDPTGAGF